MSVGLDDKPIAWPRKHDVFGVGISATTYAEATEAILRAAERHESAIVSAHSVHALVTFSGSEELRRKANSFEMITPDGQPVRWALNTLHGTGLRERVLGAELTLCLCRAAAARGVSIYLYGGASDEVLDKLKANLVAKQPGLMIAGSESPPFRALTPDEREATAERINASGAGIVFIGLGCPKQDEFAYEVRSRVQAVLVCVGAAFDFHAGTKRRAPDWMQRSGLEWLFRLGQEPRRLWKRYLVTNSIFLAKFLPQGLRTWFRA